MGAPYGTRISVVASQRPLGLPILKQVVHGVCRMPDPRTVEVTVAATGRPEVTLFRAPAQPRPELPRWTEAHCREPTARLHAFYKAASQFGRPAWSPRLGIINVETILVAPSSLATALRVASYWGGATSRVWPPFGCVLKGSTQQPRRTLEMVASNRGFVEAFR